MRDAEGREGGERGAGVVLSVYVVSPLPAVRAGLRALVGEADDLRVAGEAAVARGPGARAREGARRAGCGGAGCATGHGGRRGREGGEEGADLSWPEGEGPRPALVVLGPVAGDERLAGELAGRGWAYLSREAGGEQLIAAIRAAGSGLVTLDPALAAGLLVRPLPSGPGGLAAPEGAMGAEAELTLREGEVLGLVAEGLANKAIARRLGISEHTVKFHVAAILAKLGAGSRTEAVRLGAQRGLVGPRRAPAARGASRSRACASWQARGVHCAPCPRSPASAASAPARPAPGSSSRWRPTSRGSTASARPTTTTPPGRSSPRSRSGWRPA